MRPENALSPPYGTASLMPFQKPAQARKTGLLTRCDAAEFAAFGRSCPAQMRERAPIFLRTTGSGGVVPVVQALLLPRADELRICIVADIATAFFVTQSTTANVPAVAATGAAVPNALDAVFAALLQQLTQDVSVVPPLPANDLGQATNIDTPSAVQTDPSLQSTPQAPFDSSTLIALLQKAGPTGAVEQPVVSTPADTTNAGVPPNSDASSQAALPAQGAQVSDEIPAADPLVPVATQPTPSVQPQSGDALGDANAVPTNVVKPADPQVLASVAAGSPAQPQPGDAVPASAIKPAADPKSPVDAGLTPAVQPPSDNSDTSSAPDTKPAAKDAQKPASDADAAVALILTQQMQVAVPLQTIPSQQQSTASDTASAVATATAGAKPSTPAPAKDSKASSATAANQPQRGTDTAQAANATDRPQGKTDAAQATASSTTAISRPCLAKGNLPPRASSPPRSSARDSSSARSRCSALALTRRTFSSRFKIISNRCR